MTAAKLDRVAEDEDGLRLDRWFRLHYPELRHGQLEKLFRTGQVRLDGRRVRAGTRVESGQSVRVPPVVAAGSSPREPASAAPKPRFKAEELAAVAASVLYQDDWLVAIDKPAGLAVQGGSGQRRNLDAMLDQLELGQGKGAGGGRDGRLRLVHRLDRDTSGVLLLARHVEAARRLTAAFRSKETVKLYWAAVAGVPRPEVGRIDLPIAKQAGRRGEKVAPDPEGQAAATLYALAQRHGRRASWLVLRPLTGRTHQLRVHLAAIGHPILGDGKYGGKAAFLDEPKLPARLHLHAREISLPHPGDGTTLRIQAPLPAHMAESWTLLGFEAARGERAAEPLLD
jgi:23S rRNA pseudouridine955/2504/2580 synthase